MGTHHRAPLSILYSIAGFQDAFKATNQRIGELDMSNLQSPEVMQRMQQLVMIDNDTTLNMLFTPEEYELVNNATKENLMLDLAMAPKIKPAFLQNNLILLLYMKHIGNFTPNEQLDTYLQSLGTSEGKALKGLETPEYQFNLLFNSIPLTRQAEQLVCLLENMDDNLRLTLNLTNAYMKQDIDGLETISHTKFGNGCDPTAEELAALIDIRNSNWAEELPALMVESPSFIAVGALHLPGNNGLLNLLQKKGYTVEPVK